MAHTEDIQAWVHDEKPVLSYLIVSHDSEVILWVFLPIQRPNQADDSTPWVDAEHAWMALHQSVGGVAVDS